MRLPPVAETPALTRDRRRRHSLPNLIDAR